MAITEQQFEEAQARAAATRQAGHAVAARYDRKHGRVVVSLHMARAGGNVSAAARALGVGRATLYRRMARLGIDENPGKLSRP